MLVLDNAPFPDIPEGELQLSLRQNPGNLMLLTPSVVIDTTSSIQISVRANNVNIAFCQCMLKLPLLRIPEMGLKTSSCFLKNNN